MKTHQQILTRISNAKQALSKYSETADIFKEEIAEHEKEIEALEWVLAPEPVIGPIVNEHAVRVQWDAGYKSGLEWPDIWETHGEPGGPFVLNEQTRAENKAWREAWRKGHDEKLRTKRSNPPR